MSGRDFVGKKVRIQQQDRDGELEIIEGIVTSYKPANRCYEIQKAHLIQDGSESYLGIHYFYGEDRATITVVGEKETEEHPIDNSTSRNELLDYRIPHKELVSCRRRRGKETTKQQLNEEDDDDDDDDRDTGDDEQEEEEEEEEEAEEVALVRAHDDDPYEDYFFEVNLETLKHRASNKVEKVNEENCVSIVSSIANSKTIGVAACGEDVSRHGAIEFVLVSADSANYVFSTRFIADLRDIFESPDILKIMHMSRYFVDALYFLYRIRIENIYDTAPMHYFVVDQASRSQKNQKSVASLDDCLRYYFNLKVPNDQKRYKQLSRDILTRSLESYVRRQVLLLRHMYYLQQNRLSYPQQHSIELYALGLRDLTDSEYDAVVKYDDKLVSAFAQKQLLTSYNPPYVEEPFVSSSKAREYAAYVRPQGVEPTSEDHQTLRVKKCSKGTQTEPETKEKSDSEDSEPGAIDSLSDSSLYASCPSPESDKSETDSVFVSHITPQLPRIVQYKWPTFQENSTSKPIRFLPAGAESVLNTAPYLN